MKTKHREVHQIDRIGWLLAAVLGANDGIISISISISSLVLGVTAANATHSSVPLTAVAGMVGGAMSMATGEYISVHSQADTEHAAIAEEKAELDRDIEGEHRELAGIYVGRGLDLPLARQVAEKLMSHDALGAHARDELGISEVTAARPMQAALASACSFAVGGSLPLAATALLSGAVLIPAITATALVSLAALGGIAAKTGGGNVWGDVEGCVLECPRHGSYRWRRRSVRRGRSLMSVT